MVGADVLLVDDDVSFLRMTQESLRHSGFRVDTVVSATDAIRAVSERAFDVVVTDLVLDPSASVESSVDLIEQLKRHSPSTPMIVLSGFASPLKNQLADLRVPVPGKGCQHDRRARALDSADDPPAPAPHRTRSDGIETRRRETGPCRGTSQARGAGTADYHHSKRRTSRASETVARLQSRSTTATYQVSLRAECIPDDEVPPLQ